MTWRDQLRAASFRGVPFLVQAHDHTGGRQGVHHVYPGRDRGFVEDLGLRDRRLTIEAYVVGDDYIAARDALISALIEPGAGELIHPWLGAMRVSLDPEAGYRLRETTREGRLARFTLNFIRSGPPQFPRAEIETGATARAAADAAGDAALAGFEKGFNAEGAAEAPAIEDAGTLGGIMGKVAGGIALAREEAQEIADTLKSYKDKITGLIADPFGMGDELRNVFKSLENLVLVRRIGGDAAASMLAGLLSVPSLIDQLMPPLFPATTAILAARRSKNRQALSALARRYTAAAAVKAISARTFESTAEAEALRRRVLDAIDAEMQAASAAGDTDAVAALQDLQVRFLEDVRARAASAPRLVVRRVNAATPALVLAYAFYDELDPAADIVARNAVRHPLFVPPENITVLSDG